MVIKMTVIVDTGDQIPIMGIKEVIAMDLEKYGDITVSEIDFVEDDGK